MPFFVIAKLLLNPSFNVCHTDFTLTLGFQIITSITSCCSRPPRHSIPVFGVHINSFYTDFPCLPAVASQTRAKSGPTAARLVRRRFDKARLTVDRDDAG